VHTTASPSWWLVPQARAPSLHSSGFLFLQPNVGSVEEAHLLHTHTHTPYTHGASKTLSPGASS
jgi:hypothetical protein